MSGGMVAAQDSDDENKGLEEVIVTGTKRAMSIQDVSQSITAFTTADIEKQGLLNMEDYAKSITSMSLFATQPGL